MFDHHCQELKWSNYFSSQQSSGRADGLWFTSHACVNECARLSYKSILFPSFLPHLCKGPEQALWVAINEELARLIKP